MKKVLMTLIAALAICGFGFAQETHWPEFNIYQYNYNLPVVAFVQINGEYITTDNYTNFEIAAFVGDQCRGHMFMDDYTEDGDPYPIVEINYYYTTIGEVVTFQMYDHSNGTLYENCTTNREIITGEDDVELYFDYDNALVLNFWTSHVSALANPAEGGIITGAGNYLNGDNCTLTATANPGYNFLNWSENGIVVSSDAIYSFTVTESRNLVANFLINHTSHWPDFNYLDFETDGVLVAAVMINGQIINLTDANWSALEVAAFVGEECRGNEMYLYDGYTIDNDAPFPILNGSSIWYNNPNDEVSFKMYDHLNGALIENCEVLYLGETMTILTGENHVEGWNDPENPVFLNFICPYDISASANPTEGGIITGAGAYFNGDTCTLTAMANPEYNFLNWTENSEVVSSDAEYSFTVTGDRNLVANFRTNSPIVFADANVKALCVAHWDSDGDGELSYAEAAAVTDLGEIFRNKSSITSFNELQYFINLTSIGGYAFYNCTGLTSIELPNSVTSIGYEAFYNCHNLTSIELPNSVTSIDYEAFYNCHNLTSIELPNSVTSIGDWAFYYCTGLTSIELPNSVTSMGTNPFAGCSGLEQIIVDSGNTVYDSRENSNAIVRTSTNALVSGCKNTVIPNSVTMIGNWAFSNCTGLTSIELPDSVTSIGDRAFSNCTGLTSIELPNSVISIGSCAFYNCTGLTSIELPNSVTSIGSSAFYNCTKLSSMVVFAEIPPYLYYDVFYYVPTNIPIYVSCGALDDYQTTSGWSSFTNIIGLCSGEVAVTVNPSEGGIVTGTGYYTGGEVCVLTATPNPGFVFGNWTENGLVVSMDSVFSFYAHPTNMMANFCSNSPIVFADANVKALCVAHWDSDGDGELSYAEAAAVTDLGEIFRNKSSITSFNELQYFINLTSIGGYAFYYCTGLTSIELPNSVTSIGYEAFYNCHNLTSIELPNSVTMIGNWAFSNCTGLTSIELPDFVTSMGTNPFAGCSGLEQIIVDSGNTVYDSRENSNAIIRTSTNALVTGCKNTVIPNSVTSIGGYAFSNCTGLTSIELPNSVTSIGGFAFYNCTDLTSVTIGNSVTWIGDYAFYNCTDLSSMVMFAETPPYLYNNAFYYVPTNIPIYVPCGAPEDYQAASGWNSFTNYLEMCPSNYWTAESYQNNMFMVGVVIIDSVEQISPILELGAFCNDECRGTTLPVHEDGRWLYIMDIGGNDCEDITFRLYDHAIQQELDLSCLNGFSFESYGLIGMDEPYEVQFATIYSIMVDVSPEDAGTVTGAGEYALGSDVTLTATPNDGYLFLNWNNNGEVVSCNTTYSFTVTEDVTLEAVFMLLEGTLIGENEGTNYYLPSYSYYKYTLSQQIYTPEEIGMAGDITTIAYFNEGETKTRSYDIYMVHTNKMAFGSNTDWIAVTEADRVFSGEVTMTQGYWTTITFETPFTYNGYSNLAIIVDDNTGSYTGSPHMACRVYNANGNQAVRVYNDNPNFDPYNPSAYIGTLHSVKNQIILGITPFMVTTTLTQGWNWWSANVDITLDELKSALVDALDGTTITIMSQANGSTTYNAGRWRGTLNALDVSQMYMIKTTSDCEITLSGTPINPTEHPVSILNGFNWMAFPLIESMSVGNAFTGFAVNGDIIISQFNSAVYFNGSWRGGCSILEPKKGYMYKSNVQGDRTFTFPISTN